MPLCTTAASEAVFNAFLGDTKTDALLHGHSYTAHAVGCNVALESLKTLMGMDSGETWKPFKDSWSAGCVANRAWSMWSKRFVEAVSFKASVDHVIALGSVLAIAMKDEAGTGRVLLFDV